MEPVFFGEVERTLVAYDVDKEDNSVIVTFHCYEDQISKVEIDGDNYIVTADAKAILDIATGKIGINESIERGFIQFEGNPNKLLAFRKMKLRNS